MGTALLVLPLVLVSFTPCSRGSHLEPLQGAAAFPWAGFMQKRGDE